jgi:anaerobic selenocysteine-containing dehydrogenase
MSANPSVWFGVKTFFSGMGITRFTAKMDQIQQLLSNKLVIGAIAAAGYHYYMKTYRPSMVYPAPSVWKFDHILPTKIFNLVAPILFGILVIMARNWWFGEPLTNVFEAWSVSVDANGRYAPVPEVEPPLPFGQQAAMPAAGSAMKAYSSW